jgi:GNAT superfamily N-acetyltransferase
VAATAGFVVRRCGVEEVLPLRHAVLRPHQSREEARFPRDGEATTAHFCAQDKAGAIVSVATAWPEEMDWPLGAAAPGPGPEWRLRGMATSPEWRGKGAGAAVLEAVEAHVARTGGGVLWCNARLTAAGFYERAGMLPAGEPWEEPVIGPHVKMWKVVRAS